MRFENFKKGVKIAAVAGLTMLDQVSNTVPENTPSLNKEILEKDNKEERKDPNPESYDLSKMKGFNIKNLEEKKNLDSVFIEKTMIKSLLKDKLNKENEILFNLSEEIKKTKKATNNIPKDLYISFLSQKLKIKKTRKQINQKAYTEFKTELSKEEKSLLEIAPNLFEIVELARKDIIKLIESEEYYKKILGEFGCNEKEARLHQMIRLSNIKNANYSIVSPEEMIRMKKGSDLGFFSPNTNMVTLSYGNASSHSHLKIFYENALHELMHLVTNLKNGMSNKAIELLSESSFRHRSDYYKENNEYLIKPTERYTRLKILERELEDMGIKKIEEKFERKHYDILYNMYENDKLKTKLSLGSLEFLSFTKSRSDMPNHSRKKHFELIKRLFDEIAEIDKNKKGNTYKDQNWNYKNPTNLA
jgi:hypothetical protein